MSVHSEASRGFLDFLSFLNTSRHANGGGSQSGDSYEDIDRRSATPPSELGAYVGTVADEEASVEAAQDWKPAPQDTTVDVTFDSASKESPHSDDPEAANGAATGVPVTNRDDARHSRNSRTRWMGGVDDDKAPPYAKWLRLLSILFFVVGSVLYLVMAVDDYRWAHELLTLPVWLRTADDDYSWAAYRIEERHNESLAAESPAAENIEGEMGGENAGGDEVEETGDTSTRSRRALAEGREGGVRRMLRHEQLEEERRQKERREAAQRAMEHAKTRAAKEREEADAAKKGELQGRTKGQAMPRVGKAAKARRAWEAAGVRKYHHHPHRHLQTPEEQIPEEPTPEEPTPETLYYDTDWSLLPDEIREAYITLGYTEDNWCLGTPVIVEGFDLEEWDWVELTDEMREAAIFIGYSEEIWCGATGCDLYEADLMPSTAPSRTATESPTAGPTLSPTPRPTPQPVTDSPTKQPIAANEGVWSVKYWDDLTQERQHDLLVLGYTPAMWNSGASVPAGALSWSELSFGERFAVISLGFTAEAWDATPPAGRFLDQPKPDETETPTEPVPAPEPTLPSQILFILGAEWEGGPVPPWEELTQPMRNRAAFVGYDQERWDAEFAGLGTSTTTDQPTKEPTPAPTREPTELPTPKPVTDSPTMQPTPQPVTASPTAQTTPQPVAASPTNKPSPALAVPPQQPPESAPVPAPVPPSPSGPEATNPQTPTTPTPEELYYDEWWRDLPPEIRNAFIVLGYNETIWDDGVGVAFSEDYDWDEMTPEMQEAALTIGYSKETWDADESEPVGSPTDSAEPVAAPSPSNPYVVFPGPTDDPDGAVPQVEAGYYDDYDWVELPPDVREAAAVLGYDQTMWDTGDGIAWSEDYDWEELPPEAQRAAALLGYNQDLWDNEESEDGGFSIDDYVSVDDDYLFPVGNPANDVWVSRYQILYFVAALCFLCVGVLDLIVERHIFHVLMILAGFFGIISSIFIEEDVRTSDILNSVSVHFFLLEAITLFGHHKRTRMGEDAGIWVKRSILFADLEFGIGAFMDVILSYFYILDPASDWDVALQATWVASGVLWLHCALIYLFTFVYELLRKRKDGQEPIGEPISEATQRM